MRIRRREFLAGSIALSFVTQVRGREISHHAEIRRDAYGIPYISGSSDAACVYALGYAQAEDGLPHIEDNFIRALGRAAEVHGEKEIKRDKLTRALEIPRHSRTEYANATPRMRSLFDAFAAGLNAWCDQSAEGLAVLDRFEPWHALAFLRYKYYIEEFLAEAGLDLDSASFVRKPHVERPQGSNAWAIAPSRTSDGAAKLFINPHVSFFGPGIYYECDLRSEESLNFHGSGRFGFPLPYLGHNERLGWSFTNNYHDYGDLYVEHFDREDDPLAYRYGAEHRRAREWRETLAVRNADGTTSQIEERFTSTHHGPIVGAKDGKPLAVRIARLEDGSWFTQYDAMIRAQNLDDFRSALSMLQVPYMNVTYADADGNIFWIYNGVIPIRSEDFDWREPVDGSNPETEWRGFHPIEDLPQLLNPSSGYVQNCNSDPMATTDHDKPQGTFPQYMIGGEWDNARAKRSREILASKSDWSFDDWTEASTDNKLYLAREMVPEMLAQFAQLSADDPMRDRLAPAMEMLENWDHRAEIDSVAATLFVMATTGRARLFEGDRLNRLNSALQYLENRWGTWQVPWGEFNRLQSVHWSGEEKFSDDRPSFPVAGAPGALGAVFVFNAYRTETRAIYGLHGNSYVSVVNFGEATKARSVRALGQSLRENSPHGTDQGKLYGEGGFRPVWSPAERDANTSVGQRFDDIP